MAEIATLSDEQILDISDAQESTETPEAPAGQSYEQGEQLESAREQQSETSQAEEQSQIETVTKEVAEENAEQEASAQLTELFPEGRAQAEEVLAKAETLDWFDKGYFGTDHAARCETFLKLHDTNPQAFYEGGRVFMHLLQQNAPQEFQKLIAPFVQQYQAQSTGEAGWQSDFGATAEVPIFNFIDTEIRRALPESFSAAPQPDQAELLQAIHFRIQDGLRHNRGLALQVQRARSSAEAIDHVAAQASRVVPGIVRQILREFPILPARVAQKQVTPPAPPKPAAKPPQVLKPAPLTQDEANGMLPLDILSSARVGQRRGTSRPEDIFDTL
jgi:hypothetical protein